MRVQLQSSSPGRVVGNIQIFWRGRRYAPDDAACAMASDTCTGMMVSVP